MRISSRGLSAGPIVWLFIIMGGLAAVCLAVAWPVVVLEDKRGHVTWYGWVAEGAWIFAVGVGIALGNRAQQRKS